jgi:hypothetical protein
MNPRINKKRHGKRPPCFQDEIFDRRHKVKLLRYDVRDLSSALVENTRVPLQQKLSQNKYAFLTGEFPEYGSDSRILRYLKRYMMVFDDAMFFGLLRQHVTLKFGKASCVPKITGIEYCGAYASGHLIPFLQRSPSSMGRMEIHIVKFKPAEYSSFREAMRSYCMVLAHEMVHAFLDIYACNCSTQCYPRNLNPNVLGKMRHGAAWADAAVAIQGVMRPCFGKSSGLGIPQSIKFEREKSKWKPTREQLTRWMTPSGSPPETSDEYTEEVADEDNRSYHESVD